jgi:uncharacterized repeat protein (TIGR02543 family)
MKKIALFVLLIAVTVGAAFAETYKEGSAYKYWTNNDKDGYRFLRVATVASGMENLGFIDLIKTSAAGDPRVVEIVSAFSKGDTNFQEKSRQWKAGEKATIEEVMKDPNNIGIYRVRTGNGYFVEFATWGETNYWTKVSNRKFGVILPGSCVEVSSQNYLDIVSGGVGWDDDFQAAHNLDDYMEYLARKVDYDWVKKNVDDLKKKFVNAGTKCPVDKDCGCKGDIYEHIIISAINRAAGWGAIWGAAPPWLMPIEFVNVQAQFTIQAYLGAAIGYCSGKLPIKTGDAFFRQLKLDNYVLFADVEAGEHLSETAKGMFETAATEIISKGTELILKKIAPKGVKAVPVVGTIWGVGKGAFEGQKYAKEMGKRAVEYYVGGKMPDFRFEGTTGKIETYNGKDKNVKIPAIIDGEVVRIIGKNAFPNNKLIESVTFESNDTSIIEAGAFMNCTKLKSVTVKAPEMKIGENAFSGCSSLTSVDFPDYSRIVDTQDKKGGIGKDAFKGTKLDEYTKMKVRRLGYTGAGVGEAVPTYTVNFMMPTGAPISKSVAKNDTAPIPSNPKKEDAVFVEWNTKPDGSGTSFTASTKVTDHITLYPVWRETTITIIFNVPNGAPIHRTTVKNGTVDLPKEQPTKDGYIFVEWNTKSDGNGTAFTKTTKVTGNLTLYPKWKVDPAAAKKTETKPASQTNTNTAKPTYAIGDKGPNGGIVFDKGKECTVKDLGQVAWADADKLAKGNGSGWRLPTKAELNAMYNNLQKNNKGGFKKESYWAQNGSKAYAQNFGAGNDNASPNESEKKWVRAVKTF